jgi:hypothetical protein
MNRNINNIQENNVKPKCEIFPSSRKRGSDLVLLSQEKPDRNLNELLAQLS